MLYRLQELLIKMGAPEVRERKNIEWHYFDNNKADLAGFADIRLENNDKRLIAELKRTRENYEDDHGQLHSHFDESFRLIAERVPATDEYKVTEIAFDGDVYINPPSSVVELGLSIFHARALDISIRMVEQAFNRDDILSPVTVDEQIRPSHVSSFAKRDPQKPACVILPFKRRA